MEIKSERARLIKELHQVDDLQVIQKIRAVLQQGLSPKEAKITWDQYDEELEQANAKIEAGAFVLHDDVVKRKWEWRRNTLGSDGDPDILRYNEVTDQALEKFKKVISSFMKTRQKRIKKKRIKR